MRSKAQKYTKYQPLIWMILGCRYSEACQRLERRLGLVLNGPPETTFPRRVESAATTDR